MKNFSLRFPKVRIMKLQGRKITNASLRDIMSVHVRIGPKLQDKITISKGEKKI